MADGEARPLMAAAPSAGPLIDRAFVIAVHPEHGYLVRRALSLARALV